VPEERVNLSISPKGPGWQAAIAADSVYKLRAGVAYLYTS
jgi:hypothetical protein